MIIITSGTIIGSTVWRFVFQRRPLIIFGCLTPGVSVMEFQSDPVVLLTLSALIIIGGLGFLVWEEVLKKKRFRKFSAGMRAEAGGAQREDPAAADGGGDRGVPPGPQRQRPFHPAPRQPCPVSAGHGAGGAAGLAVSQRTAGADQRTVQHHDGGMSHAFGCRLPASSASTFDSCKFISRNKTRFNFIYDIHDQYDSFIQCKYGIPFIQYFS